MFTGVKNAGSLFGSIIRVPIRYPVMLLPLLIVWAVYAPLVVYLYFYFDWETASATQAFAIVFGFILALSILLSFSCFILLEQIRLIETGERLSLLRPIGVAIKNVWRALPITMAWALIWFAITVVEMIVRRKDTAADNEPTAENIARTLGGHGSFSLSGAFFDALKKGVRMIAFLIFPAVAWERHDKPVRRGLAVARAHKSEFASGFVLTELAAAIVFIPPAIVFAVADNSDVVISDDVWFAVIIYAGFAWSFSLLLEQFFTAELYLWDLNWRTACEEAKNNGEPAPVLGDVKRPSILDGTTDMIAG